MDQWLFYMIWAQNTSAPGVSHRLSLCVVLFEGTMAKMYVNADSHSGHVKVESRVLVYWGWKTGTSMQHSLVL